MSFRGYFLRETLKGFVWLVKGKKKINQTTQPFTKRMPDPMRGNEREAREALKLDLTSNAT